MKKAYYKSPIGFLEIKEENGLISSIIFVDEAYKSDESKILTESIKQLSEYFDGKRKEFDLPLKQEGTDFQQKIWNALRKIPYGETWSYKQLAEKIGNEKASRAVGMANSKNKLFLVIPCHRVVGSNDSLTGYAGGIERKKWLLEFEKGNFPSKWS